jgi:two-component system, cell cycle sensor histidine kinase and response regulator CckA
MSAAAEFPWTSREAKTELGLWFANAPVGLAECRLPGNITAINPVLEKMLGERSRMVRSLDLAELIAPEANPESERLLRELFAGKRDSFQIESETSTGNGRPLRWTAWRVPGTNGMPDFALALAEDATASQEVEQRLRRAERMEAVGRLAGGVAHDFNNLLTGTLLYCDLLMASLEPESRIRKYAEEIRRASLQATGLVRQLLAVARPAASAPRLLLLNEIANGMQNLLVRLIGENIELKLHLDPNLGLVRMDPAQVQQILLNLVLNARDAMPGGGQIAIETSNCKVQVLTGPSFEARGTSTISCALLVVADNGCGMDAETRAHLFQAFFTTKAAGRGTGLGLATVYDIVSSNGGLIHVDSAPGCGTRFTVLLPLAPATAKDFGNVNPASTTKFQPERNEGVLPTEEEVKTP